MTQLDLLSRTEKEFAFTRPLKTVLVALAMGLVFVVVALRFVLWDQYPDKTAPVTAMVITPILTCLILYFMFKRMGAFYVPVKEGSLVFDESGLKLNTSEQDVEIKYEDMDSLRFAFNGFCGRIPASYRDKDGEALISNTIFIKLKSGEEIDMLYAIKDAAQRRQLSAELKQLSKTGVKCTVRNTGNREANYL